MMPPCLDHLVVLCSCGSKGTASHPRAQHVAHDSSATTHQAWAAVWGSCHSSSRVSSGVRGNGVVVHQCDVPRLILVLLPW